MSGVDGSAARAVLRLAGAAALTLPLLPVQAAALHVADGLSRRLPGFFHRRLLQLCGVTLERRGTLTAAKPALFVANHISYLDIFVLSAAIPDAVFVAKREIAEWPVAGTFARLQRSVFVDRKRSSVRGERDHIAERLADGHNIVLFAEGTTGGGNRVLPFKSAFFAVAEREIGDAPLPVQPVTIAYTALDGMPLGRDCRHLVAWHGLVETPPHLWRLLGLGRLGVTVEFHPATDVVAHGSRKALARHCERVVAESLARLNAGRR